MAANFQQHMGGQGQMMQQQQRPQQQGQRPPQSGQFSSTPVHQIVFQTVTNQTGQLTGWQAAVAMQERITLIFNIIGNLRLASQNQTNAPNLSKMIEIAIRFEKEIFDKSLDKPSYTGAVRAKLDQLLERRNQNQAGLQQTIQQQAHAQAQAQAQQQTQAQQMMMMQGQQPRPMSQQQQPAQQGFQHLQHQMQASPLPGQQQQQQVPMGMGNDGLPPNMTPNQQQQFQIPMQQSQSQQQHNNLNQAVNPQLTQQDHIMLTNMVTQQVNSTPETEKHNIRQRLEQLDPGLVQSCVQRGQDPLVVFFRNQAVARLRQNKQSRVAQAQAQAQAQQLAMSQVQNMSNTAAPMQQQRSMQPSPINGQSQPPASMSGNEFGGFIGNMDGLGVQQQHNTQESGQVGVSQNGTQRNATPQPGVMTGQPMGMNNQRGVVNPGNQQQMLNAQQMQQQQQIQAQRQQQSQAQAQAQSQAQVQARMAAQAKTQMGSLQGQPGGMGNGPMPPQQSPALPTLNAPLRTPSQMSHPDATQMNPNGQFGQQLDPRFSHRNQRHLGPGSAMAAAGFNPAMFASMSQEQQAQISGLPPDRLNEVLAKWNEQKAAQAGRPMQGNNPIHPGQTITQGNQFNQQNLINQGMGLGQRPNPNMTPQQQVQLQQSLARMQQGQPRGISQIPLQMDNVDVHPTLQTYTNYPRGVPPELKKWGQVKNWVQQNGMGPEVSEHLRQIQKVHWQQLMRAKQQNQAAQAGGMQPGLPVGQPGMATVTPGLSAPVAQMGPNSSHLPTGLNMGSLGQLRQITPAEIQSARQHPSGRMANATDDQIRNYLQTQIARQRQQQIQNMQLKHMQQMAQQQQARQGQQQPQPQQIPSARPPNQPPQPAQPPTQVKPAVVAAPEPANSATNAGRAPRPASNSRNVAQNSSPAQPPKSLKRQQSDEVIEVPNPNMPQPPRTTLQQPQKTQQPQQSQQPQGQQNKEHKPVPQQPRAPLTQQQVAGLDPENRKKYEMAMHMAQAQAQRNDPSNHTARIDFEKLKTINQEEVLKANAAPVVPMDAETRADVSKMLREIVQPLTNMSKAVPRWYQITRDENRARLFFRLKNRIVKQFHDLGYAQLKDTFSITAQEVEDARIVLKTMVRDLGNRFPNLMRADVAGPQSAPTSQTSPPTSQPTPAPSVPLNAANLHEQQQQLSKLHQRSNSRNSHAPAAPTSSQPPFQFGAAKSPPDGIPAYIGKNQLTQDNLHIPARKKQRVNNASAQGAPTSSNASPQVSKAVSPEIKRQAVEPKPQIKPSLCCPEPKCDKHNIGFESEEALESHTQEEHIKPRADPMRYALSNLASMLGLDSEGHVKKPVIIQDSNATPSASKMVTSGSKQGQTPNIKAGNTPAAATPMNQQISMGRQGSSAGARPGTPSKLTPSKDGSVKQTGQKDMYKQQSNQPSQDPVTEDLWAGATIDPHDLYQAFQTFENGTAGAISDMSVYRSITPNDTPESSKDGISEPNSDISDGAALDISVEILNDDWMPFGPPDIDTYMDVDSMLISKDEEPMIIDDDQPSLNFQWDDIVDPSTFDKPFVFDSSMYSMNAD